MADDKNKGRLLGGGYSPKRIVGDAQIGESGYSATNMTDNANAACDTTKDLNKKKNDDNSLGNTD